MSLRRRPSVRTLLALLLTSLSALAQTITGSISGVVTDSSGLPVAGAAIRLTRTTTSVTRDFQTGTTGDFVFNAIEPGVYELAVEMAGFKKAQRTSINLTANERLSLGTISLEVGNVAESITVEAQGTAVQTASSEKSGVLTSSQVENLMIKGRNVTSLLQLLPGVVDTAAPDGPDRNFAIGLYVNGDRRNAIGTWLDGIPTQDTGTGWISTLNVSMDAVAEVKVLLNNYQAEYGRMRGAGVQMVSKSGTREFHGTFGYYKRHEQFNANSFFNNRTVVNGRSVPKPRYRYNTFTYNVGGPIYVPKKWNTGKNKAFFFWSQEIWPQKSGVGPNYVNMPTELERAGNFSQSLDVNNRVIPVRDPLTQTPFPGNIVPSNRLDPAGVAILKFLPMPNFFDRSISGGTYNYVYQGELEKPQKLSTLKIDYNLSQNDILAVTWSRQEDKQTGSIGLATPNSNWPSINRTFVTRGNIVSGRYQKILNPTLINELTLGYNWRWETELFPEDQLERVKKATVGFNVPDLSPNSNPLGYLPNFTFGGIPNTATINLPNLVIGQIYPTYILTDNVTKTFAKHTFKAGFFFNRQSTNARANFNRGSINFATDVNNPLETGYTYANAALGVYNNYSQANRIVQPSNISKAYEWFVQDSWKVTRRLTLEMGLRFVAAPPPYTNHVAGRFDLNRWDPKLAPQLIRPVLVNGRRVGQDPITGTIYPAVAIGAFAPNSGSISNGVYLNNQPGIPQSLVEGTGLLYSPRFGFAWDVFGNGRTAVRGGAGIFQSAGANGEGRAYSESITPLVVNQNLYYGTLTDLRSSSTGGLTFPGSISSVQNPLGVGRSYNINFSVQHNVGWGTVVDVGYVGTLGRNLRWGFDMDPLPLGANFDPKNIDPTTGRVYPAQFLRKYQGYTGVQYNNWGSSSNYHSLQTTVNRRFSKGLQFGASWTWSKWLNTVDFDDNTVSPFVEARKWNYGYSQFDRTHNLRINFLWDVPKSPWTNFASRWVLNGWQVSGITAFISGEPRNVGFSTTNNVDITGTPSTGARIVVLGDPTLPSDQRTFDRWFKTDIYALPAVGTLGTGGKWLFRGPGTENYDLTFVKILPIREPMRLQFRAEMYNAFNHTQYSGVDTTARFDNAGRLVTTSTFGQVNGTRPPRQIQLALRLNF